MMPPATGLPVSRGSRSADLTPMLESIPHEPEPPARRTGAVAARTDSQTEAQTAEAQLHG